MGGGAARREIRQGPDIWTRPPCLSPVWAGAVPTLEGLGRWESKGKIKGKKERKEADGHGENGGAGGWLYSPADLKRVQVHLSGQRALVISCKKNTDVGLLMVLLFLLGHLSFVSTSGKIIGLESLKDLPEGVNRLDVEPAKEKET